MNDVHPGQTLLTIVNTHYQLRLIYKTNKAKLTSYIMIFLYKHNNSYKPPYIEFNLLQTKKILKKMAYFLYLSNIE